MPKLIDVPGQGQVEFPDGMSDEQIVAAIKSNSAPTMGDKAARIGGLAARSAIRGATAIPTMMAEGLAVPLRAATGGRYFPSPSATLDRTLTQLGLPEPATASERIGSQVGSALTGMGVQQLALSAMQPVSQVGQGIRNLMMQRPALQGTSAGTGAASGQVAAEMGAGPVGQFGASVAGSMLPFVPGMFRGAPTPEALRTADTADRGRQIGLRTPPDQVNPSATNRILTGSIAGKAPTERAASAGNQSSVNLAVKQDLEIPKAQALTVEGLQAVRRKWGAVYNEIREHGQFAADKQFADDLDKIAGAQQTLAKEAPSLANKDVLGTIQDLQRGQWSGNTLIEINQALRDKATIAFKSGDSTLGKFYRAAADSVEEMVGRNLEAAGKPDAAARWNQGRTMIAKTHTAEAALNDATGNISGRILGSQVDAGKPVSGKMGTVGRFANAFPGAMQDAEQVARFPGMSMTDALAGMALGGGTTAYTGSGWGALAGLLPLARPATRSLILSGPYQSIMAQPNLSNLSAMDSASLGLLSGMYGQNR